MAIEIVDLPIEIVFLVSFPAKNSFTRKKSPTCPHG